MRERVPETSLRRSAFSSSLEVKMCMLFLTCLLCFPPLLALPTPFFPLYIYTYIHIRVYIHYNHLYPARTLIILITLIAQITLMYIYISYHVVAIHYRVIRVIRVILRMNIRGYQGLSGVIRGYQLLPYLEKRVGEFIQSYSPVTGSCVDIYVYICIYVYTRVIRVIQRVIIRMNIKVIQRVIQRVI